MRVEIDAKRRRQAGKAAEGDRIVEHEPPGVWLAQDSGVVHEGLGRRLTRAVLRQHDIDDQRDGQRDGGEANDIDPAERRRQSRREQRGEDRPGIAGPGDAERDALILRGIPARGQWQGDGERGAGDPKDHAEKKNSRVGMDAHIPEGEQAEDDRQLADQTCALGLEAVDQHAVDDAQKGARQDRQRDHQALLRGIEMKVIGDLHRQRPQDDPHHEAHVEVKKGRKERRPMPGSEEVPADHFLASRFADGVKTKPAEPRSIAAKGERNRSAATPNRIRQWTPGLKVPIFRLSRLANLHWSGRQLREDRSFRLTQR